MLKVYIKQIRGVSYKPADVLDKYSPNAIPIIRANNIQERGLNFDDLVYIDKSKVKKEQYLQAGDIVICASSGSKDLVGKAAFCFENKKAACGAFCKVVRTNTLHKKYLAHFFQSDKYRKEISKSSKGANINNIRNEDIDNLSIIVPSIEEQQRIADKLDKVSELIEKRQQQLDKLDLLIKSRFVEMFGEQNESASKFPTKSLPEICTIVDGDRGSNYPKQEDLYKKEHCLFLSAKNVTNSGFVFKECVFITKEKDEKLKKGKLTRGDIVLTTRGTIGNLALFTNDVPYEHIRINSGMVIIRINRDKMNEEFFIYQFKLLINKIKSEIGSGAVQSQLPISAMGKILVLMPPIELQNQFADFVEKVEQNKAKIKTSLSELNTLKKSLMQKYFG